MPTYFAFSNSSMTMINGKRKWSSGKMHLDADKKTWTCEEEQGRDDAEGTPLATKHQTSGVYDFTEDRSKLRLVVQDHKKDGHDTILDADDEEHLDSAIGKIVEIDTSAVRGFGGLPAIMNRRQLLNGNVGEFLEIE